MNLQNKTLKRQPKFTQGEQVPNEIIINRPIVLNHNFTHQQLGKSNPSGIRQPRNFNEEI